MKLGEIEFTVSVLKPGEHGYLLLKFNDDVDEYTTHAFTKRLEEICPDVKFIVLPNWCDGFTAAEREAVYVLRKQLEAITCEPLEPVRKTLQ